MRPIPTVMLLFFAVTGAEAQGLKPSDIQGLKVNASVTMAMRSRDAGREFSGQTVLKWSVELGSEKAVNGRLIRTYSSGGKVEGIREEKFNSKINVPEKVSEGTAVWVLQQNALVRLITANVGGWKLTLNLNKGVNDRWSCTATFVRFQELGKGHNRNRGVAQGAQAKQIEILSASQIKSNCVASR